jgi:hypothetical protein
MTQNTADSFVMRYIIAPSLLAGRGLGVGLSYLIYLETAVNFIVRRGNREQVRFREILSSITMCN